MTTPPPVPMPELLPCAHCGDRGELQSTTDSHTVECINGCCGARGPFAETEVFAAEQWNRRAPSPSVPISEAVSDVVAERSRQRAKLGWTTEHDDEHRDGFLAHLAAAKALRAGGRKESSDLRSYLDAFDISESSLYGQKPRQLLVEAGALILAEIERLDRAALSIQNKEK